MNPIIKKFLPYLPFLKTANGLKDYAWIEKIKAPSFQRWAIAIGTTIVLTLLLSPNLQLPPKPYKIGDIATHDIKSNQNLLVEDPKSTQEKRLEAEKSVLSVYDYDPGVLTNAENRIRSTFETLVASAQKGQNGSEMMKRKKLWESSLGVPVNQREWFLLERERFYPSIGEAALGLLASVLRKGVVNDKELLDQDAAKGITVRDIVTREERRDSPPFTFLPPRLRHVGAPLTFQVWSRFERPK